MRIHLIAYCNTCKLQHGIVVCPADFSEAVWDWYSKHPAHDIEFLSPKRSLPRRFADWMYQKFGIAPWWVSYASNANLQPFLGSVTAFTITVASLATSATWVAGQQATSVANTSAKNIDYRITAKITTGTSPTVNTEIRLYGIGTLDDGPTWPDTFGSTNAAVTVTNTNILDQFPLLQSTLVTATSNVAYPLIRQLTLAEAYGFCPNNFTVFLSHNTAVNLNSTAGNHVINYQGMYLTNLG